MKKLVMFATLLAIGTLDASEQKVIGERGGSSVKAVQYENGDWQLLVDGKPWFIKGVVFQPVRIGEDPGAGTMNDWMFYDIDGNGKNDIMHDVWVDRNRNEIQDTDEKPVGDLQILKEMGVNTLRHYHLPSVNPSAGDIYKTSPNIRRQYDHAPNKELLREILTKYGMRSIIGHFMGSWTVGSGSTWEEGCDYNNPVHRENIKKTVRAMVEDHKDEPYVLFWMLGNENNIADFSRCNAKGNMEVYLKFVNELAKMIHEMDPKHPVAICDAYIATDFPAYAKYIPDIDLFGFNAYTGPWGFGRMWKNAKELLNRPVFLTEYGIFSYNSKKGVDEPMQLKYHQGSWKDMVANRAGGKGAGNCIGGTAFDYVDRWYMTSQPDIHNPGDGIKKWDSPDGLEHCEYWGLTSMGDGKHNLFKRQLKPVYYFYQQEWTQGYP